MRWLRHRRIPATPTVVLSALLAVLPSPAADIGPADGPRQETAAAHSEQQAALEPLAEEPAAGPAVAGPSTGGKIRVLEPLPVNERLRRTVLEERLFAIEPMDPAPAAASPPPAGPPPPGPPDVDGAFGMVHSWVQAWANQDVDRYLSFYSRDFETLGDASRQEWEIYRRQRIAEPELIEVEISALQGTVGTTAGRLRISFRQAYASDTFSDVVRKTLELVHEDGGWKILREEAEDWR